MSEKNEHFFNDFGVIDFCWERAGGGAKSKNRRKKNVMRKIKGNFRRVVRIFKKQGWCTRFFTNFDDFSRIFVKNFIFTNFYNINL